jgi:transposase
MVYRDQIWLGPLQEFWEESFGDVSEPIVVEDNAPVHKKVCIAVRQDLGMKCHQHPPRSPDLNPIENIWAHMKDVIAKEYSHITSVIELKRVVVKLWNEFGDNQWNHLIESMPDRIRAVIAARDGSTRY